MSNPRTGVGKFVQYLFAPANSDEEVDYVLEKAKKRAEKDRRKEAKANPRFFAEPIGGSDGVPFTMLWGVYDKEERTPFDYDPKSVYHKDHGRRKAYPIDRDKYTGGYVQPSEAKRIAKRFNKSEDECPERDAYFEELRMESASRKAQMRMAQIGTQKAQALAVSTTPVNYTPGTYGVGPSGSAYSQYKQSIPSAHEVDIAWDPYLKDHTETLVKAAIDRILPDIVKGLRGEVKDLQEQIDELWAEWREEEDGT